MTATPDFVDDANATDIPAYRDDPTGDGLLRIQWRNGEPRMKSAGRFFVDGDKLGDRAIAAPWAATTETFESGDEAEGFGTEQLRVAILGVRQQPFVFVGEGRGQYKVWHEKWEKGSTDMRMQVDVLCLVQGLADSPDAAPVVWASSTIKTSFAIIGSKEPSIRVALAKILKAGKAFAGKDLPSWFFWLPIAGERDAKTKKPIYVETPGRQVTPPKVHVPDELSREMLNKLYVGKDLLTYGADLRAEWDEWLKERRTNDGDDREPAAAPARGGRNAPQPLDDADMEPPF
jgi:hypothetical protein